MVKNNPKKIIKIFDILPPNKVKERFITEKEEKEEKEVDTPEIIETPAALEGGAAEGEPSQGLEPRPESSGREEKYIVSESEDFTDLFPQKPKKAKKKKFIPIGIACIVVILLIFCSSLSKVEIKIKPKAEVMQFQTELNIDKNIAFIDLEVNKIPAQLFQVEQEKEKEFTATEKKEIKEKAKGIITVYNQYSSASQTLVKGTRFVSEKDKTFRTTETVVIPGAKVEGGQIVPSSVDIEIEAAEPGKEYNIEPSSFTIPGFQGTAKYVGFYGESTEPMSGGLVGKVKIVSSNDIQGAKDLLATELIDKAREKLEKGIPTELRILNDTMLIEVTESSSSVEPDQQAEKFIVKVKVQAKVLGFDEKDAVSLINDNLKEKISENKVILSDTIEINYTISDINLEKGTASLICEIKEGIAWNINIEEIRKELSGKKEVYVRQYLASRSEIESAKVIFWPFWVKKIPSNENKIKVTID